MKRHLSEQGDASERPSDEEVERLKEEGKLPAVTFNPNACTAFSVAGDAKVRVIGRVSERAST